MPGRQPSPRLTELLLLSLLASGAAACVPRITLDRAVMAYDRTTAESVAKQLLLNIARARRNQPMHFTAISNIAATYRFSANAGVSPALTGDKGFLLVPLIGASAEENPTISISPMQGEEFTQRLLTPFEEGKLTLLLRQGYDVDALLRLMGAEIRLQDPATGELKVHHNRPSDREGYPVYRRVMAHLSAVQDRQSLYVEPLHFEHVWTVPGESVTPESFQALYREFSLTSDAAGHTYRVAKRVNGRVIITNYDPATLSNEDRFKLHEEAEEVPYNDILLDIRAGHVGGEMPLHGRLRLRSFHEVLTFIARGMAEEPEYDVAPDPRTPPITENPVHTLEIVESKRPPDKADLSVDFGGSYYAVRPQGEYQWNRKVFSLLYELFQMSVSTTPAAGPAITIAK
jgi:hypothetical protein